MFNSGSQMARRSIFSLASALAALMASDLQAGEFTLDWGVIDWPAGSSAPLTPTLKDQYGFEVDARIEVSGALTTAGGIVSPDDTSVFGGNVESLNLISDAPLNLGRIGDSTVTTQLSFSYGGTVLAVDGLQFDIVDIDASDSNSTSDRCDFVTITGDNGDPALTAVSATPTFLIGPGPGAGTTGLLDANQVQCVYLDGPAISPTSSNTDTGTVRATFPDGTSSVTVLFDESIGNVRTPISYDPAPRGIGVLAATDFSVDQSISLVKTSNPDQLPEPGTTITFTYYVTNEGILPFNVGQDIVIQDDSVGTVTCPAITSEVPLGGTVECTADYTVTAADILAGGLTGTAVAGVGEIGQTFDTRLQSNPENLTLIYSLGYDFGDAPLTYLSPTHAIASSPTVYLGTAVPDADPFTQSDLTATGDDVAGIDDEDGVVLPVLTQGTIVTITVNVTGNGYLQAWLDFNGNQLFENTAVERVAVDLRDDGTGEDIAAGDGEVQLSITVPDDATTSTTYARFRWASQAGLGSSAPTLDGEVEDYSFVIVAADLVDRGDAPASYGDPRHVVVSEIYLGDALPDTETTSQFSVDAQGDDIDGIDDEDAVTSFPELVAGTTVPLTVRTHETLSVQYDMGLPVLVPGITNLQVWIDFDRNGTFEANEQVALDYRDGGNGDTDGTFNNQITLNIDVPEDIQSGITYARLRWSTSSAVTADPFDGLNLDGEVEDYLVTLSNPNGPLTCSDTFYLIATETAQNLPALSALTISESGGTYTLSQSLLPPDYTGNYLVTGWGYNELDGYIYGVRQSPRSLMRINASGQVREVADLSALAIESPDTSSDILPNGILVYMSGTNFGRYQLLDISDPANPVALGVLDTGQPTIYGRDIAYNPRDGMLYFIDPNRDIYAIDAKNGTPGTTTVTFVGNVPLPTGYFSIDMDSVWFDGSGFLYAFDNQSRQVFAVELGAEGNRPASFSFIEVQGTVANLTYQGNDGASCRAPGPFVSSVFAEGSIAGTLYQDADGSGVYEPGETPLPAGISVTLYNDNGTPADSSDDALIATADTLSDGSYLFETVDATLTYRVEVDANDPEIPAGLTVSTPNPLTGIMVATGSTTGGQDFGFTAAPASADLSLTKTVLNAASGQPASAAIVGEELDFVLTVTNEGPGNATGVTVRDLIPDGFAYVSDDATTQSDSYDSDTGLWTLGDVAAGSSHSLVIRVTMRDTGEHTNTAEITASNLPDPDSDPQTGILVDDLRDGLPDDDEATATVALSGTGATLSGTVFFDNGADATAYDGLQEGNETGTDRATVQVFDAAGDLIDTPDLAADGRWSLTLPAGYADAVTVAVQTGEGIYLVSEAQPALPGLSNPEPRDGNVIFTPEAGQSYEGIDTGLIRGARLNKDQQGVIRPGQAVPLRHEYIADAPGSVTFAIDTQDSNTDGGFSTAIYLDLSCDGTADQPVTEALSINADTIICIIARVSASAALSQGSYYAFDLLAVTTYDGADIYEEDRNRDRVTVEASQGTLSLSKTVRNVTRGTPEGVSNGAGAGDVLEYRIYLENTGTLPASDIQIFDRTPPYTVLDGPVPSPVVISSGVTCSIVSPTTNSADYSGDLRWECSGLYPAGAQGAVSFQVRVSP